MDDKHRDRASDGNTTAEDRRPLTRYTRDRVGPADQGPNNPTLTPFRAKIILICRDLSFQGFGTRSAG